MKEENGGLVIFDGVVGRRLKNILEDDAIVHTQLNDALWNTKKSHKRLLDMKECSK